MEVVCECGHWLWSEALVSDCGQLDGKWMWSVGVVIGLVSGVLSVDVDDMCGVVNTVWSVLVVIGVTSGCRHYVWSVYVGIGVWSVAEVSECGQWVWSVRWWSVGQLCLSLFIPALMRMDPQPLGGC